MQRDDTNTLRADSLMRDALATTTHDALYAYDLQMLLRISEFSRFMIRTLFLVRAGRMRALDRARE